MTTDRMTGRRYSGRLLPLLAAAVWTAAGCAPAEETVTEPELGSVVVTQWGAATELFLEYPFMVAGEQTGNWAIHLTDLSDFQPIREGTLSVRFLSNGATAETFVVEQPLRDGIFVLDPAIPTPGTYDVELLLESAQVDSRHVVSSVLVHASEAAALGHPVENELDGLAFLKEQQWVIPFGIEAAADYSVQGSVVLPGEVVAPDGALVRVSAPIEGIAAADPNRNAPSIGDRVLRGQVVAVLAPTSGSGGFAQARGRVERLRRAVVRDSILFATGAIPARRLEEARHDLGIAEAELLAMGGDAEGDGYELSLRAPISGVVSERTFVPGGRVAAGESLFSIVDPSQAWVRVQVPAETAATLSSGAEASYLVEGRSNPAVARLRSIGNVLDSGTRTVPAIFEASAGSGPHTFGRFVQAYVPVGAESRGIAIPNSAILDENGSPVAYVQVGGETFARRVLTVGATDGIRTHVLAGISAGEMVVTAGAYQVRLASLSGGDFAGGHAH